MSSAYESDPATEPIRIHAYAKPHGQKPPTGLGRPDDPRPPVTRRSRDAGVAAARDARIRYADFFEEGKGAVRPS
ncbi:hypothetical protein ACPEEZ_14180 [Frigoribacterium sp. 2-23]|uniref:hypothetical protein n=1 Tax=Frigoribacterium sp. 2-23 TaxID=3415006 RepID=UPI003C6FB4E9